MNATEITEGRKRRCMSRAELAAKLDVSETTVWRWEQGRQKPTRRLAKAIARALRAPKVEA